MRLYWNTTKVGRPKFMGIDRSKNKELLKEIENTHIAGLTSYRKNGVNVRVFLLSILKHIKTSEDLVYRLSETLLHEMVHADTMCMNEVRVNNAVERLIK